MNIFKLCISTFLSIFLIFIMIGSCKWPKLNGETQPKHIGSLTIANGRTNLMHPSIVRVKFHRVDSKQVPSWMISEQSRTFTVFRKYLENAAIFARLRSQTRLYWTSPKIQINTGKAPPSFAGAFQIWNSNEFHIFHVNMNCATNRRQCLGIQSLQMLHTV